jgi:hypothetical protein
MSVDLTLKLSLVKARAARTPILVDPSLCQVLRVLSRRSVLRTSFADSLAFLSRS